MADTTATTPEPQYKFGLSYSSERRCFVLAVAEHLADVVGDSACLIDAWEDVTGKDINDHLVRKFGNCGVVIVFWCKGAAKSRWCRRELQKALEAKLTNPDQHQVLFVRMDRYPLPLLMEETGVVERASDPAAIAMRALKDAKVPPRNGTESVAPRYHPHSAELAAEDEFRLHHALAGCVGIAEQTFKKLPLIAALRQLAAAAQIVAEKKTESAARVLHEEACSLLRPFRGRRKEDLKRNTFDHQGARLYAALLKHADLGGPSQEDADGLEQFCQAAVRIAREKGLDKDPRYLQRWGSTLCGRMIDKKPCLMINEQFRVLTDGSLVSVGEATWKATSAEVSRRI